MEAEGGGEGLPGEVERGEVEWARGDCREEITVVVVPLDVVFAAVVMVRGAERCGGEEVGAVLEYVV